MTSTAALVPSLGISEVMGVAVVSERGADLPAVRLVGRVWRDLCPDGRLLVDTPDVWTGVFPRSSARVRSTAFGVRWAH